jgi:hypothetical protein
MYLNKNKTFHFIYLFVIFLLLLVVLKNSDKEISKKSINCFPNYSYIKSEDDNLVRDFHGYECKSMVRYPPDKNDKNSKTRNDGSYFVCQDGEFKLKKGDCIVLSFGINLDDRFDEFVNQEYK